MNHFLLVDAHNKSKGHHISFDDEGNIYYNQAIHNEQHADKKEAVEGYNNWYDFYPENEPVEFRGNHGYQEYIDKAFFKNNQRTYKEADVAKDELFTAKAETADFKTAKEMNEVISYFCQKAKKAALTEWACTRFRGASLVFIGEDGQRMDTDPHWFKGSLTKQLIRDMVCIHNPAEIWYDNGVDGTDSPRDFQEDFYMPLVQDVGVCVYKKP